MPALLKNLFCITVILISANNAIAQCSITKSTKNKITTIQAQEQYEYLRKDKEYYGLSIKMISATKGISTIYKIMVKYTANILTAAPASVSFKLADGYVLNGKIKFVSAQKNDNKKVNTKVYEFTLSDKDIEELKQNALPYVEINIGKQTTPVIISVDDPTFMQSQVSCVQNA